MMVRQLRSPDEARDVLQQTFLQLHRARNDFRPGANLKPWLYTIGMNCIREQHRRRGRRRELPLEPTDEAKLTIDEDLVEANQETRLAQKRLHAALASLPENQREVIELHWFQGRPFAEVAKLVGASVSAVKVRAHRGYTKLRTVLTEGKDR